MKTTTRRFVIALFVTGSVLLLATQAAAEQGRSERTTQLLELTLRDGSRLFGTMERETEDEVVFRTHGQVLVTAPRSDVVSIRPVTGRVENGEFYRLDTHRTRLFFAPTARSLKKGQVSFGVFETSAPFLQAGVTDRFSFGGGTPLVFGGGGSHPFWITPKLQVYADDRRQAAVGVLHVLNVDGDGVGIAYGVGTFGTDDNAVTVGAGLAYADDSRGGVLMVGGERRVRPNLKLITENYVWKNGNGIVSGGVRFLGERLSADIGLAVPLGADFFLIVPVVNFVYVF